MKPVILASGSPTRRALLEAAGVAVSTVAPAVDEAAIKESVRRQGGDADQAAKALAAAKAVAVAAAHPAALVIGADQMLDCGGDWFDKPADGQAARDQLIALRGRTHRLVTAAAVAEDGRIVWQHVAEATMTMRAFSDAFLDHYLARAGDAVRGSVGAYQLEGLGAQLFAQVSGDHFTILGLQLLPVLDCLRARGALEP